MLRRTSIVTGFKRMMSRLAVLVVAVAFTLPVSAASPESSRPTQKQFEQREAMAARLELLSDPGIRHGFPRLNDANVEVLGPSTRDYNCIAHSLGYNDRWVNPLTAQEGDKLSDMDELYAKKGYRRMNGMNSELEAGKEKVVVYAKLNPDATINEVTHAARQERDGAWTSKLGSCPLVRHTNPEALRGPAYGTPVAVYVRPVQ